MARRRWSVSVVVALVGAAGLVAAPVSHAAPTVGASIHARGYLQAVSCVAADRCIAIGTAGERHVSARWNGHAWRITDFPRSAAGILFALSCPSMRSCTAVGFDGRKMLAYQWDGATWTAMKIAKSSRPGYVESVSCVSARVCVAVRNFSSRSGRAKVAGALWNGKIWRTRTMPLPAGDQGSIKNVACVSATFCVAAGSFWQVDTFSDARARPGAGALIETWNGKSWRITWAPAFSANHFRYLTGGLSCSSRRSCVAIGYYSNGVTRGLFTSTWNGTSWRSSKIRGPRLDVFALSCASRARCLAVGQGEASLYAAAETWNSKKWHAVPVPHPRQRCGTDPFCAEFLDVSCPSASQCVAVGLRNINDVDSAMIAEQWNGRTWQTV
jgi:hypothetical protein